MKTLGFAGTAKNTGKTTTALHMLKLVSQAGYRFALTSIGYDGENNDHVTGLPKPRYYVQPGGVIGTAERCLEYGNAAYSEIRPTGIRTILGEIVIAKVSEAGNVVLAGPNRRLDMEKLVDMLTEEGVELTLLDGAINRLAAMIHADGIILSTGAAFDNRIEAIARHAAAMESLFHYPKYNDCGEEDIRCVQYVDAEGTQSSIPISSILDEDTLKTVCTWLHPGGEGRLIVPGIFSPQLFQSMLDQSLEDLAGKTLVFASPLNLLTTGYPEIWEECFKRLRAEAITINYLYPIPLRFMTVNPFYPLYLQKTARYVAEYVDKVELLHSARAAIHNTAVIDIMQPPHPDLLSLCDL